MGVTQKQIAAKLQVSQASVARALSGHAEIAPETRERILSAAREMGYDTNTNQAARSLIARRYGQRTKTGLLAVTFPPLVSPSPRHMPFFTPFLQGLEEGAFALDLDLGTFQMRLGEMPRWIRGSNVDGVVTVGFAREAVEAIRALDLPVVTYQARYECAHSLMTDDSEGIRRATRYLLELGHRNIAFMGVNESGVSRQTNELRLQGYKAALADFDIPLREEWIETSLRLPDTSSFNYCSGCGKCGACIGWQVLKQKAGVAEGQRPPFTAVVCYHDPIAMGLVWQAEADGMQVPRDLSITGFDDMSRLYHFEPKITSLRFSSYEMGRRAAQLLHRDIEATEPITEYEHCLFPVELVPHESTAPPAWVE